MANSNLIPCPTCGNGWVLIIPATSPQQGTAHDLGCSTCKVPENVLVVATPAVPGKPHLTVIEGGANAQTAEKNEQEEG